MDDHLSSTFQLLAFVRLDEARIYLEELLCQDPDDPDLLFNKASAMWTLASSTEVWNCYTGA
jgi:hypothetical protein